MKIPPKKKDISFNKNYELSAGVKKVLCCCTSGLLRSPTAANVLHRDLGYNTRSVGCEESMALIPLSVKLIEWCDQIVCMDNKHMDKIQQIFAGNPKLEKKETYCLYIPSDNYAFMDSDLQRLILKSYVEIKNSINDQNRAKAEQELVKLSATNNA